MRLVIAFIIFVVFATSAVAERPYHMSCETREGLIFSVLDKLTDAAQLTRNSVGQTVTTKDLAKGVCDYKQFTSGSVATEREFWADESSKLIYVTFKVEYPNDTRSEWDRIAYAADIVVSAARWIVGKGRHCGRGYVGLCLIPRSCDVLIDIERTGNLIGFNDRQAIPDYVYLPSGACKRYIIK